MYWVERTHESRVHQFRLQISSAIPQPILDHSFLTSTCFWSSETNRSYLGTSLDKRLHTTSSLFSVLEEVDLSFIPNFFETFQASRPQALHFFLPRILCDIPDIYIPAHIKSNPSLERSGFLNHLINHEYSYYSYFLDHPPHIDLIDYPDAVKQDVYTFLLPLTCPLYYDNGGLLLDSKPWSGINMSHSRSTTYPTFSSVDLQLNQFIVWDQYQPHIIESNKTNKPLFFFRMCFTMTKMALPRLSSRVITRTF